MKIKHLVLCLFTLLEAFGLCYTASFDDFAFPDDSSIEYNYNRFPEIEKHCSSFLSSASELKPDDSRGYRLKNELSFFNGDWKQESGGAAPLMPFDDTDTPKAFSSSRVYPLKLVSFEVKDVNSLHHSKNIVSLTGILSIGISRNSSFITESHTMFHMRPGLSALKVVFQGVYVETEENGGEHLTCLLGDSTLPVLNLIDDLSDTTDNFGSSFNRQPKLLQDDQIFLVLRYPKTFNLTKRAIRGEMRSLNEQESFKYFDEVLISSQLGSYSKYQFSNEKIKPRTCDPNQLEDEMVKDGVNLFNGSEFCRVFKHFSNVVYNVEPNWRYNGRYLYHETMGPFQIEKEFPYWSFGTVRLVIKNIICEPESTENNSQNAKVSALLRAFPVDREKNLVPTRTGISETTMAVEGIWNSSTGYLCMVGCLGISHSGLEQCDSRISLYFPRSLSVMQRSLIVGSISTVTNVVSSYFPILFRVVSNPSDLHYNEYSYVTSYLSYNYTKIDLADGFRERTQPSKFFAFVKQSLLTYPSLDEKEELMNSLHRLSDDFYINSYPISNHLYGVRISEFSFKVEVLSLGPLLGRDPRLHTDHSPVKIQAELTKFEVLNVSLHLTFTDIVNKISLRMFLEGLYDPRVGEMYLIGCKEVSNESNNIERGLDCLNEVKIEYPSETLRWLKNPIATITVTSRRNEGDRLYFSPIRARTSMIQYRKHESDVLFRKVFEGVLRVLLLLLSISIILSQLFYMKKNEEAILYISLVMLTIQIFGYSLPLISRTDILFSSKESESYRNRPYDYYGYQTLIKVLENSARVLVLVALLLTARLFQMVSNSRKGLDDEHGTSKTACVPDEKRVLLITLAIHILVFSTIVYMSGDPYTLQVLMIQLWKYMGVIQEWFLLPQIIGYRLWKPRVGPFQRIYGLGFTLIWIFSGYYDAVRDPIVNPYSEDVPFPA